MLFSGNLYFYQYNRYSFEYFYKEIRVITSSDAKYFVNSKTYREDTFDYYGNLLKSVDEKGTTTEYSYLNGDVTQEKIYYKDYQLDPSNTQKTFSNIMNITITD